MRELAWDRARKGEEYEDLAVLTLMIQGAIHQLNLVGAEVWTRINGINTAEKIAAEIAPLFQRDLGEHRASCVWDASLKPKFLRAASRNPLRCRQVGLILPCSVLSTPGWCPARPVRVPALDWAWESSGRSGREVPRRGDGRWGGR